MKADEPHLPLVKYGMTAEYQDRLVERHFAVLGEDRAISAFHFAQALHAGPKLCAAPNKNRQEPQTAPVPVVLMPEPAAEPMDLRGMLGLS